MSTTHDPFLSELLGGLNSAREHFLKQHGDHAAMVCMRLEQAMEMIPKLHADLVSANFAAAGFKQKAEEGRALLDVIRTAEWIASPGGMAHDWRVHVKFKGAGQTTACGNNLIEALERAAEWLAIARQSLPGGEGETL